MKWLRRLRWLLTFLGALFIAILVLPVTHVPWRWYQALATPGENDPGPPEVLILMGGGGIPSESGLMRSWIAANMASNSPRPR